MISLVQTTDFLECKCKEGKKEIVDNAPFPTVVGARQQASTQRQVAVLGLLPLVVSLWYISKMISKCDNDCSTHYLCGIWYVAEHILWGLRFVTIWSSVTTSTSPPFWFVILKLAKISGVHWGYGTAFSSVYPYKDRHGLHSQCCFSTLNLWNVEVRCAWRSILRNTVSKLGLGILGCNIRDFKRTTTTKDLSRENHMYWVPVSYKPFVICTCIWVGSFENKSLCRWVVNTVVSTTATLREFCLCEQNSIWVFLV